MSTDTDGKRARCDGRTIVVPFLLWSLFLLFTATLILEWAVIFFPVFELSHPYTVIFLTFHDFRLLVLDLLTLVLPLQAIEYVGVVFSLGGICITLMMISARQSLRSIVSTNGGSDIGDGPDTDPDLGVLTLAEIWIGAVVVIVLWMLATEQTNLGLETSSWAPLVTLAAISAGLVIAAWFAGYVRIGSLRLNPLHWVIAGLAISYGMTWL